MASNNRIYDGVSPALVVPDHFFCNQSSTIVAIYNEPLGEEWDSVTLMFPGDDTGSSPKRVIPRRVGNRTLIFETPVPNDMYISRPVTGRVRGSDQTPCSVETNDSKYFRSRCNYRYTTVYSTSRGMVEVLPLLSLPTGEVELLPFKISQKHPVRNVMEMCLNLSTHEAVLPVLLSLMMHCKGDKEKQRFQDAHIDRIMATLVGSRAPGTSTSIKDVILPGKKWSRLNLAEFAKEFNLSEMEKQANLLRKDRLSWAWKRRAYENIAINEGPLHSSSSSPDITTHRVEQQEEEREEVRRLLAKAELLCQVIEAYQSKDRTRLPLKVGEDVYVVEKQPSGLWYGVCNRRHGYFPAKYVRAVRRLQPSSESPTSESKIGPRSLRSDTSVPGGQTIKDEEMLKQPLIYHHDTTASYFTATDTQQSDTGTPEGSSFLNRMQRMNAVQLPLLTNITGLADANLSQSTDSGLNRLQALPVEQGRQPKSPKKVPMLPVMVAPRSPLLIRSFISHNENTDSHDGSDTAMFSEQNKLYKSVPNQPGYYMNQEPLEHPFPGINGHLSPTPKPGYYMNQDPLEDPPSTSTSKSLPSRYMALLDEDRYTPGNYMNQDPTEIPQEDLKARSMPGCYVNQDRLNVSVKETRTLPPRSQQQNSKKPLPLPRPNIMRTASRPQEPMPEPSTGQKEDSPGHTPASRKPPKQDSPSLLHRKLPLIPTFSGDDTKYSVDDHEYDLPNVAFPSQMIPPRNIARHPQGKKPANPQAPNEYDEIV